MNAGRIVINLSAGTADFIADLDKANARLRDFGASANRAGSGGRAAFRQIEDGAHHSVTAVQATSAALRTFEGGLTNNLRAAERFVASFSGLRAAAQAFFPIAGGIAVAGILEELTTNAGKAYEAFKKLQEAPQRIAQEFRQLNAPMRESNDELDLTNAKLENEIAKLSGKPQNGLKEAIIEARLEADKLADSLDKSFKDLGKLLKENEIGALRNFVTGETRTDDLTRQFGEGQSGFLGTGLPGRVQKIVDQAQQDLDKIQPGVTKEEQKAATLQKNAINARARNELENEYGKELKKINDELAKRKDLEAHPPQLPEIKHPAIPILGQAELGARAAEEFKRGQYSNATLHELEAIVPIAGPTLVSGTDDLLRPITPNAETHRVQELEGTRRFLLNQQHQVTSRFQNEDLEAVVHGLQGDKDAAALTRPYRDKINELDAQLAGVKTELASIGQGVTAETLSKSWAEAAQAIAKINDELRKRPKAPLLSLDQETNIRKLYSDIEATKAEEQFRTKFEQTTTSIRDRITALKSLTAAIGQGYEAQRNASAETEVRSFLGKNADDPKWMADHQEYVKQLRQQYRDAADAQNQNKTAAALDPLRDQIDLETRLADAEMKGAAAVRDVELSDKIAKIEKDNLAGSTKELTQAMRNQAAAAERVRVSQQVAQLQQEVDATNRLTAAQLGGAEAVRQAQLENRIAQIKRDVSPDIVNPKTGVPVQQEQINAVRQLSEAQRQQQIVEEALRTGNSYQDRLDSLDQQIAALRQIKASNQDNLDVEISLNALEKERAKVFADQVQILGSARDGMKAYFEEMATAGTSAAEQVHDSLKEAFDGLNDSLARLASGQKANWAGLFRSISADLAKMSLRNLEVQFAQRFFPQTAPINAQRRQQPSYTLGGSAAAQKPAAFGSRDGQTAASSLFVTTTDASASSNPAPSISATAPDESKSGEGSKTLDRLVSGASSLFKIFGGFRAEGGSVDSGMAHVVGEEGPELFVPDSDGTIIPNNKLDDLAIWNQFQNAYNDKSSGKDLRFFDNTQSNSKITGLSLPTQLAGNQWADVIKVAQFGLKAASALSSSSSSSDSSGDSGGGFTSFGGSSGGGNSLYNLTPDSSGLIQRTPIDGLSDQDVSNLGGFDNSELGQLDTSSAAPGMDLSQMSGPSSGGSSSGKSTAANLAMMGATLALGIISEIMNQPKDHHFKPGNPYTIPAFNSDGGMGFGGYRASGGPVDPGYAYVVGERGPEVWMPPASGGSIIPNSALGGNSGDVYIDARGTDPMMVRQAVTRGMIASGRASVQASIQSYTQMQKRMPEHLRNK